MIMEIYSWKIVCAVCALLLNATGSLSQLDVCGQPPLNPKIVGGGNAAPGSWPWQVIIQLAGTPVCGGSLINQNWVLSAAQCLEGFPASFFKINLQVGNGITAEKNVSRFIIHERYSSKNFDNDIALVQLSSSVTFSNYVMPVCLAASNSKFPGGTNVWVTGWGRTSTNNLQLPKTLQEVQLPILSNKDCDKIYANAITDNMICAGLARGGKDICVGDAGGPMVVKESGTWIQAGIVSFLSTKGCAVAGVPGGYTRVSRYQDWIKSKISSNQPGFVYSNANGGSPSLFCLLLSVSIIPFLLSLSIF